MAQIFAVLLLGMLEILSVETSRGPLRNNIAHVKPRRYPFGGPMEGAKAPWPKGMKKLLLQAAKILKNTDLQNRKIDRLMESETEIKTLMKYHMGNERDFNSVL